MNFTSKEETFETNKGHKRVSFVDLSAVKKKPRKSLPASYHKNDKDDMNQTE